MCGFGPGMAVEDLIRDFSEALRPAELLQSSAPPVETIASRLVLFGVLNGMLVRLHEHPVSTVPAHDPVLKAVIPEAEIRAALDGAHCLDELECFGVVAPDFLRSALTLASKRGLLLLPVV